MLRREGSSPSSRTISNLVNICGNSSVVERHLAKVDVAGPTPVSRSKSKEAIQILSGSLFFIIIIFIGAHCETYKRIHKIRKIGS